MQEIWKAAIGYEGLYCVSNLGRIKTLPKRGHKEKIMSSTPSKDGYMRMLLCKNSKYKCEYIHRLVAFAFLNNPNGLSEVNHIDGNKSNNNVANLEWVTRSENAKHAYKLGLRKNNMTGKYGKAHKNAKAILQCDLNGNVIKKWDAIHDTERLGCFRATSVSRCLQGLRKTYRNYIWKYDK